MVVAMNKIDKPGIDVEERKRAIENQLLEHDIVPEGISADSEYGSPVQFFPISAKTGEGLDDLIEGLALQSEVMDLRADNKARAEGIVMDARVEQGLGIVADCIIRWGCIEKGDIVVSDTNTGKVRILKDGTYAGRCNPVAQCRESTHKCTPFSRRQTIKERLAIAARSHRWIQKHTQSRRSHYMRPIGARC